MALVLTQKVLAYTKGLSVKLQGCYVDVVHAYKDVESVKTTLRGVQSRVDDFHTRVYKQVLQLGQSVDVMESAPRQASRQQHRQNIPSDNISDYYKRNFTIPILDHLISELSDRFNTLLSLCDCYHLRSLAIYYFTSVVMITRFYKSSFCSMS